MNRRFSIWSIWRWDYKLAWRLLSHSRKEKGKGGGRFFSASFGVAVIGMAFGVMALLLALGITEGFTRQYEKAVLGSQPHVMIQSEDDVYDPQALEKIVHDTVKNVKNIEPVLYREAMLIGGKSLKGILLKGVHPDYFKISGLKVTKFDDASAANPQHLPEIYIGKSIMKEVGLEPGVVKLLFPKAQSTQTSQVSSQDLKSFFLAGIFESGVYEVDSTFGILDLNAAQSFFNLKAVSGFELWLDDVSQASFVSEKLRDVLSFPYEVLSWKEVNENIFKAMETEKWMFGVLMFVLVLVASLNVLGTLMMLLLKKRHEIAVLRSLGYSWTRLRRIFLMDGVVIGIAGTLVGIGLGLICEWILKVWEPIQLDPEIYFLKTVPVAISLGHILSVFCVALLVCVMGCLLTLRKISKIATTQMLVDG